MSLSRTWICWTLLGLCASLSVSAQNRTRDQEVTLDQIHGDGTQGDSEAEPGAHLFRCNKAAWRVPGQYLVMLHQGTYKHHVQRSIRRLRAKASRMGNPLQILQTFSGALHGFLVKMNSDVLHLALKLPHVHYIEEDSSVFAQTAPWNLQRLMQPHGGTSENGSYRPPNDGQMVEVYLMDGSVQSSHREVQGRVRITDFNNIPEEDGVRVHRQANQCDSHGTHIAGVISGKDSGVAQGARVNLVRVLNCQGKGTVSGALAGMEYIRAALLDHPADAVVVLLPFTGSFSHSLNAACRDLVAIGAVVIAAAGNYRDDACLYSPASEPKVITVGAVNAANQLMSQGAGGTNFGRCVDLFAPGDDIVSASSDCSTCFTTRSGTSQAAAHAAGKHISTVLHVMLHYSIRNTIDLLSLSDIHRLTTPNLVAAMPPNNSTNGELLCRSVWSERSGFGRTDRAISRCHCREEMMGCRGYAPNGVHVGEMNGGQMECVAYNGPGSNGMYAVAHCCMVNGLRCLVHASSEPGQDAECVSPQHHLTGCTSWSNAEVLSNSRPHLGNGKRCVVKGGVTSHAVCCYAPEMECQVLENTSADKHQVEVSCPSGWTLTDCSAISEGSALLGLAAEGNSCHVTDTSGTEGAGVIAVCCRTKSSQQVAAAPQ
uniref:Proprotein convertase subtilisin/kexin type 9 n=1 Tax=Echeneis naucrates TaxID=173247 RepID=A0A665VV25_ECHNA